MDSALLEAYAVLGIEPDATDDEVHSIAQLKLKVDIYGDPEGREQLF